MPDITMCSSINCPMRESCYRVKAIPENCKVGVIMNIAAMRIVGSKTILR